MIYKIIAGKRKWKVCDEGPKVEKGEVTLKKNAKHFPRVLCAVQRQLPGLAAS